MADDYTEGIGLPNLSKNGRVSKKMLKDRYQSGSEPSKKHITNNPADAGYLHLRIKSSKAFPMDDVGAIEELISKVKKTENNLKESQQQEAALEYR